MPESQSQAVALAVRAATEWMEVGLATPLSPLAYDFPQAVTGKRFPADRTFRATLEDGVLLCE